MPGSTKPKASPRVRQKRRKVRQEIIDVAERVLHERGFDAVTLASIAGELGMTKQALYHYFPSKDALASSLVTRLFDAEIDALIAAVESERDAGNVLGTMMRAFYAHYVGRLDTFRLIYCQSQLSSATELGMDAGTIREEINPRTRRLFDALEERLAGATRSRAKRQAARRLAFTAWTSALGLLTMLSIADATGDPLAHPDAALLDTLARAFDGAALA